MIGVSDALDISSLSSCLNFVTLGHEVDEHCANIFRRMCGYDCYCRITNNAEK